MKSYINRNKFRNIRQTYDGYSYDSRLEARYAAQLDMLKKAVNKNERVKKWERQQKISIDINGIHICNYFIDFKVWYCDGRVEFHECKGFSTDLWQLKWKLTRALYPDFNLVLIK